MKKIILTLCLMFSFSFFDIVLLEYKDFVVNTIVVSTFYSYCKDGVELSYIKFHPDPTIHKIDDKNNISKPCKMEPLKTDN